MPRFSEMRDPCEPISKRAAAKYHAGRGPKCNQSFWSKVGRVAGNLTGGVIGRSDAEEQQKRGIRDQELRAAEARKQARITNTAAAQAEGESLAGDYGAKKRRNLLRPLSPFSGGGNSNGATGTGSPGRY